MTDFFSNDLFIIIASACLSVLFAHAALIKIGDKEMFQHHLASYGIAVWARLWIGRILIGIESLIAVALLSPWREWGAFASFTLLLLYAFAMGVQLLLKRTIDCGCGTQALPVSWALVYRNVLLSAVSVLAWQSVSIGSLGVLDFFVVCAAVLLSTVLYTAIHQVLFHQAQMRQRLLSRSL
jgi:hypothetical protein